MIPIRDLQPTTRKPVVVMSLIAACFSVFAFELYLAFGHGAPLLHAFATTYGVVPARLLAAHDITTTLTSMFVHGGVLHLLGNMWFLWVFGDNVEDRMGHL
ncbi:MAG: rhomboid family intramembrane serine protease, partial [Caldilineaceae bacterium]|nr:rhomboid family intramembrane serine protease [Caldilineaceae bacterium]